MAASDPHLPKLRLTLTTTSSLLQQFLSALSTTPTQLNQPPVLSNAGSTPPTQPPATGPLPILATSSTLIKAHTTKLSLLLLNPPFTPSALSTVLHDLSAGALPVLMTGVELCAPEVWGKVLASEVRGGARGVLLGLVALVEEIETVAFGEKEVNGVSKALARTSISGPKTGVISAGKGGQSRDSLASTGIIWDACDVLIKLQEKGLSGLVVDKAKEYRDMLDDAIKELREWSDEAADDEGEEDEEDEGDFLGTPSLPAAMRPFLMQSLKTLQRISLLYRAVMKHRLKTIPAPDTPSVVVSQVDTLMEVLGDIPSIADDLASAFYDLDEENAKQLLRKSCVRAREVQRLVSPAWSSEDGEAKVEDDFSKWLDKWAAEMGKGIAQ